MIVRKSLFHRTERRRRTLGAVVSGLLVFLLAPAALAQVQRVALCEDVVTSGSAQCDGADIRIQGTTASERQFGFSVVMGYLDGDNFQDVLIGSPAEGRVWVIYGGIDNASPAETSIDRSLDQADLVLFSSDPDSDFGFSIAVAATDLNNPVLIGAPSRNDASSPGLAYRVPASFFASRPTGTVDVATVADLTLVGEQAGDQAGYSVAIGPVRSAGAEDAVVGARLASVERGRVYAVPASATGNINLSTARKATGVTARDDAMDIPGDGLGEFLAIADFVAGGTHEVAVAAVGTVPSDTTNSAGGIWIVNLSGGTDVDLAVANSARSIRGDVVNDFFGFSIVAGDLDGDGTPDLVAGAIYADRVTPTCSSAEKNAGAVYFFQNATLQGTTESAAGAVADKIMWGFRKWDELGFGLALGDVNSDGDADLLASARRHDRSQALFDEVNEGAVYVFHGGAGSIFTSASTICLDCPTAACTDNPPDVDAMLFGADYDLTTSSSDEVGFSLAAGDFNGDSVFADIAVSSIEHERVYLVSLRSTDALLSADGQATDDFRDIRDRDDDGDGYLDTEEDADQDGVLDAAESDPLVPNTDAGVSIVAADGGILPCDETVEVTATISNFSRQLTFHDPRLRVTLPGAPFEYVPGSTFIVRQGQADIAVTENPPGTFPFADFRSLTQDGSIRPDTDPLAATPQGGMPGPAQQIQVRFELRAIADIPPGSDPDGSISADVQLPVTDNELPFPHATAGLSQPNSDQTDLTLLFPALAVEKTASVVGGGPLNPLDELLYTITVTNNGTFAAGNVVLTDPIPDGIPAYAIYVVGSAATSQGTIDDSGDPLVFDLGSIATGATATVSFMWRIDEDVADEQIITNQATVSEQCIQSVPSNTTQNTAIVNLNVDVTKVANPTVGAEPSETVDFTVQVMNSGSVRVTLNSLTDDLLGNVADGANPLLDSTTCVTGGQILIGATYMCTFTAEVSGNAGDVIVNTISAVVEAPNGDLTNGSGQASVTFVDVPSSIAVTKSAMPSSIDEPGGNVTFTVGVTNTSPADTVTLDLIVDDENNDGLTLTPYDPTVICDTVLLAPAAVATCTFTRAVIGLPGEVFTDLVTVTGTDDDGGAVNGADTASVTIDDVPSSISVVKTATPDFVMEPGGNVTFDVTVTNTSVTDTVTLDLIVDDENNDGLTLTPYDPTVICDTVLLAPAAVANCAFTRVVTGLSGEVFTDLVTVMGTDDDGVAVSGGDTASVTIDDGPSSISVVKTATPDFVEEPGGNVTFDVTVTNTSATDTVTLEQIVDDETDDGTNLTMYDPAIVCNATVLAPAAVADCSFVRLVVGVAPEVLTDRVTVSGTDDDGQPVSGDATADVSILPAGAPMAEPMFNGFEGSVVVWSAVSGATNYHLYRGDLAMLAAGAGYVQDPEQGPDAARFCWLSDTQHDDGFTPAPGQVMFYLVTADDGVSETELGRTAGGALRENLEPCRSTGGE